MRGVVLVKQEKQGKGLGYTRPFHEAARKIAGVVEAYPILGRFDDVIFLETRDYDGLLEASRQIGLVPGVKSTETLPERP